MQGASDVPIEGACDARFERVREAFRTNFTRHDLGPRWQNPRNRALVDSVYASLM